MLSELHVSDLGVVESLTLTFGPGMTAVTGETGAGKTLIVTAIELLVGGRADASMVRMGADEAVVEGRFVVDDDEIVVRRVIPATGRSRAYLNGRMASIAELSELGAGLVDLHGQHEHQSLLSGAAQRAALDRFGAIDLEPLRAARVAVRELDERLSALGGDPRERAREIDLLRFQVDELVAAGLTDPAEDDRLRAEADLLGDATGHGEAAQAALASLADDDGAVDAIARAIAAVTGRAPFDAVTARLAALAAELDDLVHDLRSSAEGIESDPARLEQVGERRRLLGDLRRKYGDTLAEVIAWRETASGRLAELETHDERAAVLDAERIAALAVLAEREAEVLAARRAAAPALADAVAARLPELALPKARLAVEVDGVAGRDVVFTFSANSGMELQPLARAASGGELARAMLALRLVLTGGPPVLVFDEVDAGIGGAAAVAVGRALAAVATGRQAFVVTHLAQVAASADAQFVVDKVDDGRRTVTTVSSVTGDDRITELARMLSGAPDSEAAREHARELLAPPVTSASSAVSGRKRR